MTVDVATEIVTPRKSKIIRKLELRSLEVVNDGDKNLMIFRFPRDVRGAALLTFTHPVKPNNQFYQQSIHCSLR
jgi:hypothetical protein